MEGEGGQHTLVLLQLGQIQPATPVPLVSFQDVDEQLDAVYTSEDGPVVVHGIQLLQPVLSVVLPVDVVEGREGAELGVVRDEHRCPDGPPSLVVLPSLGSGPNTVGV